MKIELLPSIFIATRAIVQIIFDSLFNANLRGPLRCQFFTFFDFYLYIWLLKYGKQTFVLIWIIFLSILWLLLILARVILFFNDFLIDRWTNNIFLLFRRMVLFYMIKDSWSATFVSTLAQINELFIFFNSIPFR